MVKKLSLWRSSLPQVKIVERTQRHWTEHGRIPSPHQIDPDAEKIDDTTTSFANALLLEDEPTYRGVPATDLRGFFEPASAHEFNAVLPRRGDVGA